MADVVCDTTPPILQQATNITASFVANTLDGQGLLSITVTWATADPESGIAASFIMLGTTTKGQQLLAPTEVASSPISHMLTLPACPNMVFVTLSVKNAAGTAHTFTAEQSVSCA